MLPYSVVHVHTLESGSRSYSDGYSLPLVLVCKLSLIEVNCCECTIWLRLLQYPSNRWEGVVGVGRGVCVCVCLYRYLSGGGGGCL